MKIFLLFIALALALPVRAQTNVADEPSFSSEDGKKVTKMIDPELRAVVKSITTNWIAGRTNATDIAKYVKSFDDLLARHKDEKTEAVAQMLYAKENFYFDVLGDCDTGSKLLHQLARDYPDTELGRGIGKIIKESEQVAKSPPPRQTGGKPDKN